jgi:predicted DNA-binding ArsR family transcriptional regulator
VEGSAGLFKTVRKRIAHLNASPLLIFGLVCKRDVVLQVRGRAFERVEDDLQRYMHYEPG